MKILKSNNLLEKLTLGLMFDYLILFSLESILPGSVMDLLNLNWLLALIIVFLILLSGPCVINNLFFQVAPNDNSSLKNLTSKSLLPWFLNNWKKFSANQTSQIFQSHLLKNLFVAFFISLFLATSFFIFLGNDWWKEIFYLFFILLICLAFYKIIIKK